MHIGFLADNFALVQMSERPSIFIGELDAFDYETLPKTLFK